MKKHMFFLIFTFILPVFFLSCSYYGPSNWQYNSFPHNHDNIFKRAEAGEPEAQYLVGLHISTSSNECAKCFYLTKEEGLEWFKKAAEQNHSGAQFLLGVWLIGEDGLADMNIEDGREWIRKAASQGHVRAREWLENPPLHVKLSEIDFNRAEAENILVKGNNTILGLAVACEGRPVYLTPVTAYAIAIANAGLEYLRYYPRIDPEYLRLRRETIGDAGSSFEFTDVADGEYFVSSAFAEDNIAWRVLLRAVETGEVPSSGGFPRTALIHKRVSVSGGAKKHVILVR